MDVETLGTRIRQFLRDLFGSRLNAHLEDELFRLRGDFEARLLDRERTIAELREQVATLNSKVDRYEMVLLPLSSPMGGFFAPKKERELTPKEYSEMPAVSSWAEFKSEYESNQEAEAPKE